MAVAKPKQCVCGKYPSFERLTYTYQRGRYKADRVRRIWKASCRGCGRVRSGLSNGSREQSIQNWNTAVLADREERDSPDKLVHALQSSGKRVELALARLLVDTAAIKKKLGI